ncbi:MULTISPECIES: hypothetical protein [unclassified Streptomyces]|uniref:hypothetical protein n=1 Tax=unclassified Streptomyces TaxID=2593676 RepID=UPI0016605165|nr:MULTISPECIES: hypothetical protein [unclassified Streptomyces]MBD0712317.1 hypothetical protein [Streptomyces sp. CBMA291]MBD0716691.1 hypothetical protein [Streptomyces sp. CBMA370]
MKDKALTDGLFRALEEQPVPDVGRHLMLLSTIGELGDASAAPRLESFVWSRAKLFPRANEAEGEDSLLNFDALLQARAAEMLSYLDTEEAARATLRIAADHPERAVRAAAIDAHLFNHGDSAEAVQEVMAVVRPEDRQLVGLTRLKGDMDPAEFERRVNAFYERYPEERPPVPHGGPEAGAREEPPSPRGHESNQGT